MGSVHSGLCDWRTTRTDAVRGPRYLGKLRRSSTLVQFRRTRMSMLSHEEAVSVLVSYDCECADELMNQMI